MDYFKMIPNRITEIRMKKKISSRKMSIEMGFSHSYISEIENYKKLPSLDSLIDICNYFGIKLEDFFKFDIPYEHILLQNKKNNISPSHEKLISYVKTLDKETANNINELIIKFTNKPLMTDQIDALINILKTIKPNEKL